jgi:hypothetical protein
MSIKTKQRRNSEPDYRRDVRIQDVILQNGICGGQRTAKIEDLKLEDDTFRTILIRNIDENGEKKGDETERRDTSEDSTGSRGSRWSNSSIGTNGDGKSWDSEDSDVLTDKRKSCCQICRKYQYTILTCAIVTVVISSVAIVLTIKEWW